MEASCTLLEPVPVLNLWVSPCKSPMKMSTSQTDAEAVVAEAEEEAVVELEEAPEMTRPDSRDRIPSRLLRSLRMSCSRCVREDFFEVLKGLTRGF